MNQVKRKNEIITKLLTIESQTENSTWKAWLSQTIEFIKEDK